MSISVDLDECWSDHGDDVRQPRIKENVASFVASLIVNAAFVVAMIWETNTRLETLAIREITVELIAEPPPEIAKPAQPIVKPETKAERDATSGRWKGLTGALPNIADEERKLKAPLGERTIEGAGADKMLSGAQSESKDEQDSDKQDSDPDKEISRIIPPAAPKPIAQAKPEIEPPGPEKKLAAQSEKPDAAAADSETAIKRKPIECGVNAMASFRSPSQVLRGQVLRLLTRDEALKAIQKTQFIYDMHINPNYVYNVRAAIHVDDAFEHPVGFVLLPLGISARVGDRVEFVTAHPDPSMPCHYIPNLVSRVL